MSPSAAASTPSSSSERQAERAWTWFAIVAILVATLCVYYVRINDCVPAARLKALEEELYNALQRSTLHKENLALTAENAKLRSMISERRRLRSLGMAAAPVASTPGATTSRACGSGAAGGGSLLKIRS